MMAAFLHNRHLLVPYLSTLRVANLVYKSMASSRSHLQTTFLPSDPDFLLDYMAGLASDDSNDDFDGYLLSDDEQDQTEDGNNNK